MTGKVPEFKESKFAGSLNPGEPAFVAVGKLRRPHGLKGEILLEVLTDFPERIKTGRTYYVGDNFQPLRIQRVRAHHKALILQFEDFDTPEAVGELRNQRMFVPTEDIPDLPVGDYYHHQLLKLIVISDDGERLGQVVEILETGSNDVLVIRAEVGPELLLPLIEDVVQEIDLVTGVVRVRLMPGLRPD